MQARQGTRLLHVVTISQICGTCTVSRETSRRPAPSACCARRAGQAARTGTLRASRPHRPPSRRCARCPWTPSLPPRPAASSGPILRCARPFVPFYLPARVWETRYGPGARLRVGLMCGLRVAVPTSVLVRDSARVWRDVLSRRARSRVILRPGWPKAERTVTQGRPTRLVCCPMRRCVRGCVTTFVPAHQRVDVYPLVRSGVFAPAFRPLFEATKRAPAPRPLACCPTGLRGLHTAAGRLPLSR